ncbi:MULTISPECIES: cytochrome c biogenesis CcdA family protein [Amycolatopsis]|uniref:Cytochrome C biogenesis protein n=1 Tax=Amycolatopsis antarctica TaxID=1854586 RepID=A0A263CXN5_9PSEU|nr:cytochrome c biogenesis protein CcdA [Amycolatopsis antarctica]OZM70749.1 cytochrome C biogenesis protein [Amycolatopsis antarctica]
MTGPLLALAFGAGMLAPVNPCGFAVLPAFLTYAVDTGDGQADARPGAVSRLAGGLRAGLALAAGFASTFTVIGLLLALGLRSLTGVIPWLAAALGAILAVGGVAMVAGWHLPLRLPTRRSSTPRQGPRGMVALGAGYALASASCTLALLLAVVTQALASTNISGVLVVFGAYAAGSATLLLSLALFAAFASSLINRFLRRLLPHMKRITGAVLALSGGYLLLYWLPQLLGGHPGTGALTGIVGTVSAWITGHQLAIVITALGLILATTIAALAGRRRSHTTTATAEDCCTPNAHLEETMDQTPGHRSN